MKRSMRLTLVILAVIVSMLTANGTVMAFEDVRTVRLIHNVGQGGESYQIPYLIEPEILTIRQETVVVWVNVGAYEASVIFDEAKKCQAATKDPSGDFKVDEPKVCYLTVVMGNGGTSSLKFTEKGVYEYRVKWANQPRELRGKVIVY